MLYEIEPSRNITGGAWYSEQEFDSVFIDMLQTYCFKYIASKVRFLFACRLSHIQPEHPEGSQ